MVDDDDAGCGGGGGGIDNAAGVGGGDDEKVEIEEEDPGWWTLPSSSLGWSLAPPTMACNNWAVCSLHMCRPHSARSEKQRPQNVHSNSSSSIDLFFLGDTPLTSASSACAK